MSAVDNGPLFLNHFCLGLSDEYALLVTGASSDEHEVTTVRALLLAARLLVECVRAVRANSICIADRLELPFGFSNDTTHWCGKTLCGHRDASSCRRPLTKAGNAEKKQEKHSGRREQTRQDPEWLL